MRAKLVFRDKIIYDDGWIVQVVIWQVPSPVPPSEHGFKYRLYAGKDGQRIVGFDNERGKGDHKHLLGVEMAYEWFGIEALLRDFRREVEQQRGEPA